MNDKIQEYEYNLREAQRMAENSKSDADKAGWLRIAQQWLRMIRVMRGDETPQEDQSAWPAASDDDSKSSH
jgi:hypothetical protein